MCRDCGSVALRTVSHHSTTSLSKLLSMISSRHGRHAAGFLAHRDSVAQNVGEILCRAPGYLCGALAADRVDQRRLWNIDGLLVIATIITTTTAATATATTAIVDAALPPCGVASAAAVPARTWFLAADAGARADPPGTTHSADSSAAASTEIRRYSFYKQTSAAPVPPPASGISYEKTGSGTGRALSFFYYKQTSAAPGVRNFL
jgi:hypothetical protein